MLRALDVVPFALRCLQRVAIAGRQWEFRAVANAAFWDSFFTSLPWVFLGVGVLCIVMVIIVFLLITRMQASHAALRVAEAASLANQWLLNYVVSISMLVFVDRGVPKFSTYGSVCCACAQRPGLPRARHSG